MFVPLEWSVFRNDDGRGNTGEPDLLGLLRCWPLFSLNGLFQNGMATLDEQSV